MEYTENKANKIKNHFLQKSSIDNCLVFFTIGSESASSHWISWIGLGGTSSSKERSSLRFNWASNIVENSSGSLTSSIPDPTRPLLDQDFSNSLNRLGNIRYIIAVNLIIVPRFVSHFFQFRCCTLGATGVHFYHSLRGWTFISLLLESSSLIVIDRNVVRIASFLSCNRRELWCVIFLIFFSTRPWTENMESLKFQRLKPKTVNIVAQTESEFWVEESNENWISRIFVQK